MLVLLFVGCLPIVPGNGAEVIAYLVVSVVELILCVVILFLVPGYTIGCGLLSILICVGAFRSADSPVEGWTAMLIVFGAYVAGGFVYHRGKVIREQEEIRAAAKARRLIQNSSAAYALGKFAYSSDLCDEFRRMKAMASGELEDFTIEECILRDAISIIRLVVLPKDEVRHNDAEHLKLLCEGAGVWREMNTVDYITLIERAITDDLLSLQLLVKADSQDRNLLRDKLLDFCVELENGNPKRQQAVQETQAYIRMEAMTTVERLRDLTEQARKAVEDLQATISENHDAHYDVLGVSNDCTGEQLKAAYRDKVAQWHPDRLEQMAPELRAFATERLAQINNAYEQLKTSYSGL